jgi:hypothetical protein
LQRLAHGTSIYILPQQMPFIVDVGVLRGNHVRGVFTEPSQLILRRLQVSTDGEQRRQKAINPSCVTEERRRYAWHAKSESAAKGEGEE